MGDKCELCYGLGELKLFCKQCDGQGYVDKQATEKILVPKGVDVGTTLRFKGLGCFANQGKPGDLVVEVFVRNHSKYRREGFNIVTEESITVT